MSKLFEIITLLANGEALPQKCVPHKLTGNYEGFWECHVSPDWLLLYEIDENTLYLSRTGSHSDLFR